MLHPFNWNRAGENERSVMKHVFIILYVLLGIFQNSAFEKAGVMRTNNLLQNREEHEVGKPEIRITVIYDNYQYASGTRADWGFSCLIEGLEQTILFDTGADAGILEHNMNALNLDPRIIDQVVISHMHWDHTGSLDYILFRCDNCTLYLPHAADRDEIASLKKHDTVVKQYKDPVSIQNGVFLSGEMGSEIREQSLIIDTENGLLVITGCSHPGIITILKRARRVVNKEIALVAGGFHMLRFSDRQIEDTITKMDALQVKKCGGSHCTGERAIELMKAHFRERYIDLGTGRVLTFEK